MKKTKLPGNVWRMVYDQQSHQLFLDIRSEDEKRKVGKVDLADTSLIVKDAELPSQSELIGASEGNLFLVQYLDPNDPNEQTYFKYVWSDGSLQKQEKPFFEEEELLLPQIYLHGTEHHQTVAKYLKKQLPLSCEYLEWNGHVIISYYLRLENKFERHLLILKDGLTKAELLQDREVKGFSPGAFFVIDEQLIFIREQHEVCFYTG